ncbi:MAG TPA: FxsA family protein [Pirellulales bacterium]|jgi:UPF0716 protein FxsA|nr:FxsA family protein [Pirellulales bacterium]
MIRYLGFALLFPVVEIVLLVRLAQLTSVATVLLYLLVAGLIGSRLIARPGLLGLFSALGRLSGRKTVQSAATGLLSDRLLEIAAGLLLILPGVLSDLLAVALLVPALRSLLMRWAARFLPPELRSPAKLWQSASRPQRSQPGSRDTIDVHSRQVE